MNRTQSLLLTCALMLVLSAMHAQTVYVPIRHPVYDFLDRLESGYQDGMLSFVRPLPRADVALHLEHIAATAQGLTMYDRQQLAFYREEFQEELRRLHAADTSVAVPQGRRWHLLQVDTRTPVDGYLAFDFVAQGSIERGQNDVDVLARTTGVAVSGYAGSSLGFGMRWTDNSLKGVPYDVRWYRTPRQAAVPGPGARSNYQYEVAEGQFTWSNAWLSVGFDKLDRWQGSGRDGSIILSDRVPCFPALTLSIKLSENLRFDYFHGWLFSDSLDLDRTQPFYAGFERQKIYAGKYFASHVITFRPEKTVQLALGESIIYSDQVNPLFLIPVISFRAADRWTHASTGNSQFFADVRWSPIRRVLVYGTGYVDELDASKIFGSNKTDFDYQVAYTLGAVLTDLYTPLTDLASETRVEFSRTYPYVYMNPKITQQYTSHQVILGHWIGPNADLLTIWHTVHPLRALELQLRLRLGRFGEGEEFLPPPPRLQPSFLYGRQFGLTQIGASAVWMPWHDVRVAGTLTHTAIERGERYRGTAFTEGWAAGLTVGYGVF